MQISQLFSQRSKYLPFLFLLWGGCIFIIYMLWFPSESDNPYPAFGLILWITWVAIAIGSSILRYFKVQYVSQAERLIFSAGLGFGLLAYLVFGLGLAHLLYSWVAYVVFGLLTILSLREIKHLWRLVRYYLVERTYTPSLFDVLFGAFGIFLAVYHFLGTLIPPVLFDALVYHLAIPKLYTLTHGIEYYPHSFFSNFPFMMEMLYTLGLILQGAILVNCLNYVIHLLLLAGIYGFARTYFNHRIALLSVLIFYTVPWVGLESFLPYIDIGLGFYTWLALYALINWISRKETGWLLLCGMFTGITASIKYFGVHTGFVIGLSVIIYLFWKRFHTPPFRKEKIPPIPPLEGGGAGFRSEKGGTGFRLFWYFALPALLIGSPWYIKNLIWTGNPIYPFWFGGGEWDSAMLQRYMSYYHLQFATFRESLWFFLQLPWNLVFQINTPGHIPIGPIFLLFLPLLLFVRRVPPLIKYLLAFSLVFMLLWYNTSPQSRFLITIFPFLSIATGYTIENLSGDSKRMWPKRIGYVILSLLMFSNVCWELIYVHRYFSPFKVIMGEESTSEYLSRHHPDLYPITQYANETLPLDAQILYIGDTRGYYANRKFIANSAHDKTVIVELTHQATTIDDLADKLRVLGITHIIFNKREGSRLHKDYKYLQWKTPEDEAKFREFYRKHLKLLHTINDSDLLEIVF